MASEDVNFAGHKRLGDLLLEEGLISEEVLSEADEAVFQAMESEVIRETLSI